MTDLRNKCRKNRPKWVGKVVTYALLGVISVTMVLPFGWMICTSLKSSENAFSLPIQWLPRQLMLSVDGTDYPASILHMRDGQCEIKLLEDVIIAPRPYVTAEETYDIKPVTFEKQGNVLVVANGQLDSVHSQVVLIRKVVIDAQADLWMNYQVAVPCQMTRMIQAAMFTVQLQDSAIARQHEIVGKVFEHVTQDRLNNRLSLKWENFRAVIHAMPFGRYYLNSIIVAICVTLGQVITSAMAAYAFARLQFPFRDKLFLAYLATLMIPAQVTMIPLFVLMTRLNLVNTMASLILPGMFSAYGTFMLRQFFLGIPYEMEEAASIDGAGYASTFIRIILPMSKPALATLCIFTFMGNWNAFIWPLIMISDDQLKTLPVGIAAFNGTYSTDWTLLMAGCVMMVLPLFVVFVFGQRFFTKGIQLGAVKG